MADTAPTGHVRSAISTRSGSLVGPGANTYLLRGRGRCDGGSFIPGTSLSVEIDFTGYLYLFIRLGVIYLHHFLVTRSGHGSYRHRSRPNLVPDSPGLAT